MNKIGYYVDYVSSGNSKGFMGQSQPRITLSKAIHNNPNPLSQHNYTNPYTYNIIVYMMCITYVLLLLSLKD